METEEKWRKAYTMLSTWKSIRYSGSIDMKPRSQSWILRTLDRVFGMSGFTTVLWKTIYYPSNWQKLADKQRFGILAHELQHIEDRWMQPLYLLPHILALIPIIAVCTGLCSPLWLLVAGLLASPLPNWLGLGFFRAWFEVRGYSMQMFIARTTVGKSHLDTTTSRVSAYMTTGTYYWPMPIKWLANAIISPHYKRCEDLRIPVNSETAAVVDRILIGNKLYTSTQPT